jgi:hypothetical protein
MPEVWQMTLARFVGDFPVDDTDARDLDLTFGYEADGYTGGWLPFSMRPVGGHEGFFFADIGGQPLDIALVQRDDFDGDYTVVGYYCDEQLWLDRGVRGRGLSAELVLAKADRLNGPIPAVTYTTAGLEATRSAHRLAVQRALRNGCRVPDAVMADYAYLAGGMQPHGAPLDRHGAPEMAR